MASSTNTTTCLVCITTLVKNGKTAAGTQRWRCPTCGASSVRKRSDVTRRHQLTDFLTWLVSKHSQTEHQEAGSDRTFRRNTAWCWDIQPRLGPVTVTYEQVLVDGIWIGTWCLLIAVTEKLEVLAWQWSGGESKAAWVALMERIPAPTVVVTDGGTGIAAAIRQVWPDTKTQRCLFHVQMNIRRHLTMNPRSDAARRLRKLSLALSDVRNSDDAITWRLKLEAWWQSYGALTEERTYDGRTSWFTHDRLRKAWQLLAKLTREGTLFTYVEYGNVRTTSPLEGGINNGIRHVLRSHRGMPEPHMKRAVEWFLTLHEIPIEHAHELIAMKAPAPDDEAQDPEEDTQSASLYDAGISAEEGLWGRSGWAGRT